MKDVNNNLTEVGGQDDGRGVFVSQEKVSTKGRLMRLFPTIVVSAVVLCSLGFFIFSYYKSRDEDNKSLAEVAQSQGSGQADGAIIFHEMEDVLVNLGSESDKAHFFRVKVILEMRDNDALVAVKALQPKIYDVLLSYMRTLPHATLKNSVALYRLREEIMMRVNKIIYPAQLSDVLFRNFLVQ